MTLESRINRNRYIGNGAARTFPFTFKVWKDDQVRVFVGDGSAETDMTPHVSVSRTASGGSVTFPAAPESGKIIVIRRDMPYIQEDDYRNGTRFDAEEVEDRFDQDCAERQDLRLDIDRAIKVPMTAEKTQEEYERDFWDAYSDTKVKHDAVAEMYDDFMSEVDHQIARAENMPAIVGEDTGNACMEMNWTLNNPVPAGSDIDIHPLWYVVGRHHLQVSVNGVRQYSTKQYVEKGDDNAHSNVFTTLVDLNAGDTINVWIAHLNGHNVSAVSTQAMDGLMSSGDKTKLDGVAAGAQVNVIETVKVNNSALPVSNKAVNVQVPVLARTTTVLSSAVAAGTAITVPSHTVNAGLLMVWHNGVLCERGTNAQYVDNTTTTIKFNYNLPAGDTITAAAVAASV